MVGYTISGLDVNEDQQVLDGGKNPIEGLYAAGDIACKKVQSYPFGTGPSFIMGGFAVQHGLSREIAEEA